MATEWDLVIAGAGPAGCALAAKSAARDAKVLLLEKSLEPGTGRDWIVDIENSAFEVAGVPFPSGEALWREPERTVLVSPNREHRVELPPTPLTPVRNGVYVRQLAAWAVESGACLRTGCNVSGPLLEGGKVRGVVIEEEGDEEAIRADLVADCTGISGTVRRSTPEHWGLSDAAGAPDTVVARREVRRIDVEAAAKVVEKGILPDRLRLDRTSAHGTYSVEAVYLDLEGGFIDILVGIKPSFGINATDKRFDEILEGWPFVGEKIFGGGGPIPIRRPLDAPAADGLLVLGDSACQVIPAHGSGTASALISADLASETIARAIGERRFDRAALWDYCFRFQTGRGALLAYYDVMRKFADTLDSNDLDELMARRVLTGEEVFSGLVPEPFKPRPMSLIKKVARGYGKLPLLIGFARTGLKAQKVMRHFKRYPESFNPETLAEWSRRIPHYP